MVSQADCCISCCIPGQPRRELNIPVVPPEPLAPSCSWEVNCLIQATAQFLSHTIPLIPFDLKSRLTYWQLQRAYWKPKHFHGNSQLLPVLPASTCCTRAHHASQTASCDPGVKLPNNLKQEDLYLQRIHRSDPEANKDKYRKTDLSPGQSECKGWGGIRACSWEWGSGT